MTARAVRIMSHNILGDETMLFERRMPVVPKFEQDNLYCVCREISEEDRMYSHVPEHEYTGSMTKDAADNLAAKCGGKVMKWAGYTPHPSWEPAPESITESETY
jgi:hypothetical protein